MVRIGNYIIENETNEYYYNWFHLLPFISIQHKYWYLYKINFGWLNKEWMIEITHKDWNKNK